VVKGERKMAIQVKINNNTIKVPFKDLEIGDCYRDGGGSLCIKTANSQCIYLDDDTRRWNTCCENPESNITPVKATLTIEE
jgi:DNA-binding transcriptional regulator YhcF (GntR family)